MLLSVIFPLLFVHTDWFFISSTYGKRYMHFELFGFFITAFLLLVGYLEVKRLKSISFEKLIPILAFLAVAFYFLVLIVEYSQESWDYKCYEFAAKALINGQNPYGDANYIYIYPPLLAESLANFYLIVKKIYASFLIAGSEDDLWFSLIFYTYQCSQFYLLLIAYLLSYSFARKLFLKPISASIIISLIFFVNNPLLRTLKHNQVNLWVLDLMLFSMLFLSKQPLLSGISLAISTHIKIYPLLLVLPLAVLRRFWALAIFLLGTVLVFAIQTNLLGNFFLWEEFIVILKHFPKNVYFRNNSIYSFVHNIFGAFCEVSGGSTDSMGLLINTIVYIIILFVFVYFIFRFISREKSYKMKLREKSDEVSLDYLRNSRLYGHFVDTFALMLFISPMVWAHHYVFSIPIVIWTISVAAKERPWKVLFASALILVIPTFDVFPFSYHRILGLIILIYYARPKILNREELFTASMISPKPIT